MKQLTKIRWHLICSPIHPRHLRQSRFKPFLRPAYILPVEVVRLNIGGLHAVGWGEGPRVLATPEKAIMGMWIIKRLSPIISYNVVQWRPPFGCGRVHEQYLIKVTREWE